MWTARRGSNRECVETNEFFCCVCISGLYDAVLCMQVMTRPMSGTRQTSLQLMEAHGKQSRGGNLLFDVIQHFSLCFN